MFLTSAGAARLWADKPPGQVKHAAAIKRIKYNFFDMLLFLLTVF